MFGGMKRRGMRAIVSRGPRIGEACELGLECGHTVSRNWRAVDTKSAVCPECIRVDGEKRDAANKAKAGSA